MKEKLLACPFCQKKPIRWNYEYVHCVTDGCAVKDVLIFEWKWQQRRKRKRKVKKKVYVQYKS